MVSKDSATDLQNFIRRTGRSEWAAGFTRITTWALATITPVVFSVFAWFVVDLINTERQAIAELAAHQRDQDVKAVEFSNRITAIETDRTVRIQKGEQFNEALIARMDRTEDHLAEITKSVVTVTTKLDDLIAVIRDRGRQP